jgi:hypothetical protein
MGGGWASVCGGVCVASVALWWRSSEVARWLMWLLHPCGCVYADAYVSTLPSLADRQQQRVLLL